MGLDFFTEEGDINESNLKNNVNEFLNAVKSNTLSEFRISEDEYEILIDYFIDSNDIKSTELCAELAFEQHPYSSRLLAQLCDTLILGEKIDEAISILDNYIDSFSCCSSLYIIYARAYIKTKQFDKAREWYKKAKVHLDDTLERYDYTYSLALDCIEVKEFARALYFLNELDLMNTKNHEFYNDFGYCFDRINHPDKAIEYYNKYLDTDPFNDVIWFNIGTMYAKINNYDTAIEAFNYSLAINPKNDSSHFNLALVFLSLGRYKEAISPLKFCIECDRDSLDIYYSLADAYIGLKDFKLAKETYAKLQEIDSNNTDAAILSICIDVVQEYLNENYDNVVNILKELTKDNYESIPKVYKINPSLANDSKFLELLLKIKK